MFKKILIANRGEIACRVIRTAKALGIHTVAIYSEADRHAPHVQQADEAYFVGPSPSSESYLNHAKILSIAKNCAAEAIHPGYGFLSENTDFAKNCEKAGIVFIGPSIEAIEAMGSKQTSKQLLSQSTVPLIPGYHESAQDLKSLLKAAEQISYPLLIKAAAGGGGKGMRIVRDPKEFPNACESAKREAKASFADDTLILEKYIENPRHIEVQVFGDKHGNVVHLFERDCSIQRRHQKIIEETPAQHLPAKLRDQICAAAVTVAQKIKYVGAGTVEFLVDSNHHFYFMEMNTRLQVEHPITEMVTGYDLVAWQLSVAFGEPLPVKQADIQQKGHAIECRIYAEDPDNNFMPATGHIDYLRFPTLPFVRVDTGIQENQDITPYYDPMIAKLIVWAEDRSQGVRRTQLALAGCHLAGPKNNINYLQAILHHPDFENAKIDTGFIERNQQDLLTTTQHEFKLKIIAALILWHQQKHTHGHTPWDSSDSWRLNLVAKQVVNSVEIIFHPTHLDCRVEENTIQIPVVDIGSDHFLIQSAQEQWQGNYFLTAETCTLFFAGYHFQIPIIDPMHAYETLEAVAGHLQAPMPGTVVAIMTKLGNSVQRGDRLIVIEAMKMEHTIHAPADGIVEAIHFQVGQQVTEGAELIALKLQDEAHVAAAAH